MTDFEDELYRQLADLHKLRSNVAYVSTPRRAGKSIYNMVYGTGHGVYPMPDKFWDKARYVEVTLLSNGECRCKPYNTPLGPLGLQSYMLQEKLPKWVKDKIMKLQMLEPFHEPVAGIGQNRYGDEYWVLAPYKYLPRERWRR